MAKFGCYAISFGLLGCVHVEQVCLLSLIRVEDQVTYMLRVFYSVAAAFEKSALSLM